MEKIESFQFTVSMRTTRSNAKKVQEAAVNAIDAVIDDMGMVLVATSAVSVKKPLHKR